MRLLNRVLALAFAIAVLLSALPGSYQSAEAGAPVAYLQHDPIEISGNAAFNASNGVVKGTGTSDDPFMIQGWEIKGMQGTSYAIFISKTTAYFTVTQVHVTNSSRGVYFLNVTHGKIDHSLIDNETVGVSVFHSDRCSILDNTIRDCGTGILLAATTSNIRVDDNSFARNIVNLDKPRLPWEETWIGTAVCLAILIPLIVLVSLALYFRITEKKKPA